MRVEEGKPVAIGVKYVIANDGGLELAIETDNPYISSLVFSRTGSIKADLRFDPEYFNRKEYLNTYKIGYIGKEHSMKGAFMFFNNSDYDTEKILKIFLNTYIEIIHDNMMRDEDLSRQLSKQLNNK